MTSSRTSTLAARHAEIEARIGVEEKRPRPDGILVGLLKRQKLKIKETLTGR